jgi:PAS domain S-box-containing protein
VTAVREPAGAVSENSFLARATRVFGAGRIAGAQSVTDLLLKAQVLGHTGYVISDVARDRVYWSASLFEQRRVPPRAWFTRGEAIEFLHPEDRPRFEAARDEALRAHRGFEIEMRVLCGDGAVIWEHCVAEPQFDAAGNYSGLLSVVRDITESRRTSDILREQEARYRTLFDGAGDALFLLQRERFIECNTAAMAMFRASREELIGSTPVDYSPAIQPDGRPSLEKAMEKIGATVANTRQHFEWRHRRGDGTEFDAEVTLNGVDIPDGSYFIAVVRDITERKQRDSELKAALGKFSGAFDASDDAMIVIRIGEEVGGGIILDANRAAERILGHPRAELINQKIAALKLFPVRNDIGRLREETERTGSVRDYRTKVVHQTGEELDVVITMTRFPIDDYPHLLVIVRDVTDTTRAQARITDLNDSLASSLRQLRAIADNLPVAISYQDPQGRFRFVNRTLERWCATTADNMLGRTVAETMPPDYLATVKPLAEKFSAGETRMEAEIAYPDGKRRFVEVTYITDIAPDGTLMGRFTLAIDLTERKAAEEQLHQSQRLQAIGKLTGGVAHDFNNLLAVISGNLELASEAIGDSNESVKRLLQPAQRSVERGATLTRSLLAFARQQPLSPSATDLNSLARDMTELVRRTVPSNIVIEFSGGAGLWKCEVDGGQLQNALLNLVVNARDAMPDGGRLCIETANVDLDAAYVTQHPDVAPGPYVMLSVSDTGTGMPPEVVARVFEPFFTTKGVGKGTGLGLSMVYGFVSQSGGHVAIDSAVGKGTTLRLYLPRWMASGAETAKDRPVALEQARNETILVVEDDPDVRLIAVTMLQSLGYTVLEAEGGESAFTILRRAEPVTLLLTDLMLAGSVNGRHIAEQAVALKPGIKILFMSGYTENTLSRDGRSDAGVRFVQKPFRKQDLAAKVREAIDSVALA